MYCIKCGVEMANHEKKCPLCGTPVCNPNFIFPDAPAPYPKKNLVHEEMNRHGILFIMTFVFLIPILLTLICDLSLNGKVLWSGYAVGTLSLGYLIFIFPLWFRRPNPVIFVPVSFAAVTTFLLYINFAVGGHWFLSFAFPVIGMIALIVTAVVALVRYIKRGYLYIFGGASFALSASLWLTELLMNITFFQGRDFIWCIYPMTVFTLLGIFLIVTAICPPLRDSLKRKFFM